MEHVDQPQIQVEPELLGKRDFVLQVLEGIGIAAGLGLLWAMETVRNSYFRLLDRWNIKPRRRTRASAFPPGKPRRRARRESRV